MQRAQPTPVARPPGPHPLDLPGANAIPAGKAIDEAARRRQLEADTNLTMPSGATLLGPKGWWLTQTKDAIVLEDPEGALRASFIESREVEAVKAIAAGWQWAAPGVARVPEHDPEHSPPDRGWDAVTKITYESAAAPPRVTIAYARRFAATTYVTLVDSDAAAFSRRWPELDTAMGTLQPRGMREESFAGKPPRPIDGARARALDAFIARTLGDLEVPGAAVAIVAGRQVVYEKAIGVRSLGKRAPVTPNTLFMMGSITKPMTTMMEAALIDAGAFTWETPVTAVLPTFALGDPDVTRQLRMWHMACACTGMPQQDLEIMFEFDDVTPEQRLASMSTMKPTTRFGETFQYSNLMVAAGGFAAAHAYAPRRSLGEAYAEVMRRKIFRPIGMRSTTLDFAAAERGDHAMPHGLGIDGRPQAITLATERSVVPIAPAGAVWSNLRDMERFAITELANGVAPDGKRVVSEGSLLERRKPRARSSDQNGYGIGLDVGTFHGLPMIGHTGGLFGFGTTLFMLPEQGIAIVILTNIRNGGWYEIFPFNAAVKRRIVEELFEGAKDISPSMVTFFARTKRDIAAKAREKLDLDPDRAWVRALGGTYLNASLGRVRISPATKGGIFDAGEWRTHFAVKKSVDGTVRIALVDAPHVGGEAIVGGEPDHPTLTIEYGQARYVFKRVAP